MHGVRLPSTRIGRLGVLLVVVPLVMALGITYSKQDADGVERALNPHVVFDDASGDAFVAWAGGGLGNYDIWLTRGRNDDGTWVFEEPISIVDDASGSHQWAPQIAQLGRGHLLVVWEDERTVGSVPRVDRADVFAAEVTWNQEGIIVGPNFRVNVGASLPQPLHPVVVADGKGGVFLAWSEETPSGRFIHVVRGGKGDAGWAFETLLAGSPEPGVVQRSKGILWDATRGQPYVFWIDDSSSKERTDERVTVVTFGQDGEILRARADTFEASRKSGLAASLGPDRRIHLAWSDDRLGPKLEWSGDVFLAAGEWGPRGWEFEPERRVHVEGTARQEPWWNPSVAALGGPVVVVSTVGRAADAWFGPVLDNTYLSISVLTADDSGRGSLRISTLVGPGDVWWNEPHVVRTGHAALLLVWTSGEGRSSFLMARALSIVEGTISLGSTAVLS